MRALSFFSVVMLCGCATAADDPGVKFRTDASGGDVTIGDDSSPPGDAPPSDAKADSAITTDGELADSAVPSDTSVAPDTSVVPDTAEEDTFVPPMDTSPPPTDTAPTCSSSGSYGPKCATNADCAAIPTCGYVCCAFDPITKVIPLGCGRTSIGGSCLP